MSVSLTLSELLGYSDHERAKWRAWVAADPKRLDLTFQPGGRFPTLWSILEHMFLVERRHLARLEGSTPPDATAVAAGDWEGLFEYADLVRADFRQYVEGLDEAEAHETFTFTIPIGTYTTSRRKLVTHMLLHETRHWAQVAHTARTAGIAPPGEHDLFFFAGIA
ncbi:MAG TPA: DinB family protein [Vicinamibacterales bacterium]